MNYMARVSKVKLGNSTIDYPIESNLWQLPMKEQVEFLQSVIRNGESSGMLEPQNYEEWIRWKLGDKICDEYMLPYNTKLWGVKPSEMDIDWLYKIPRVNVGEILQYALQKKQDVNKFPAHIHFYYPKSGGFQAIFDALYEDEKDNVILNEKVTSLNYNKGIWHINGKYDAKNVINTTPWNDLYPALGSPKALSRQFSKIQYNRIYVTLYRTEYQHDWHWRYVPELDREYHREFYIPNFAFDSKPGGVYVETNAKRYTGMELFDGQQAIYSAETAAAYPIPVIGHKKAIYEILSYYEPYHLYGVGRWGQHEYQNADVSMYEAIRFVKNLHLMSIAQ